MPIIQLPTTVTIEGNDYEVLLTLTERYESAGDTVGMFEGIDPVYGLPIVRIATLKDVLADGDICYWNGNEVTVNAF